MIVSIDARKVLGKIQHPIMIKILSRLEIGRDFLNLIRGIFENSTSNVIFNGKRLNPFPFRLGISKDLLSHHFYSALSWQSYLDSLIKQEIEINVIKLKKKKALFICS